LFNITLLHSSVYFFFHKFSPEFTIILSLGGRYHAGLIPSGTTISNLTAVYRPTAFLCRFSLTVFRIWELKPGHKADHHFCRVPSSEIRRGLPHRTPFPCMVPIQYLIQLISSIAVNNNLLSCDCFSYMFRSLEAFFREKYG